MCVKHVLITAQLISHLVWILSCIYFALTSLSNYQKQKTVASDGFLFLANNYNFDTKLIGNKGGNLRSSRDLYLLWL